MSYKSHGYFCVIHSSKAKPPEIAEESLDSSSLQQP